MLSDLHIENIAVIERADVEFDNGLCVLTGETGAGKSIVIDSINAVLGERTAKDLIRAGESTAKVTARFTDLSAECRKVLSCLDISDEDGDIIITRIITPKKSSARINDVPVTAAALKSLAPYLVNIHGQHDSQQLLDPDRHYIYVDLVAKNSDILSEYKAAFSKMQKTRKRIMSLANDEERRQRRCDVLKYAVAELEKAEIRENEIDELKNERDKMLKNREAGADLSAAFSALDSESGLLTAADAVIERLINSAKQSDSAAAAADTMSNARDLLSKATEQIKAAAADCEFDEQRLSEISERLDVYYGFIGKYGKDEREMLDYLENAKRELESLNADERDSEILSDELIKEVEEVKRLGAKLTKTREKAAAELDKQVERQLNFLNMNGVKFKAEIKSAPYSSIGADKIEFLIQTNAGENMKPLSKIASGGEMSRIMLAIKCVLSDSDPVGTMIFDEIDQGISGEAALKVGDRLKSIGKHRQVVCVTHLAQIACMAGCHLLIKKSLSGGRTFTSITKLDDSGRLGELARIIGGGVSDAALNAAKELIERNL